MLVVAESLDRVVEVDADVDLVERARQGERAAFEELVRRHQRPIYWLCRRYLKSDVDAEDVAQRAFVQAFLRLSSLRRRSSFRTWVYRIAINLSMNAVRDRSRRRDAPLDAERLEAPTAGDPIVEREDQRRLRGAVEQLPPKQRLAVELRAFEELSFREIAAIVGSSEDSAKMNYHHALRRLRELIGDGEDR